MDVCCECCVLPGRGLCDKLITRPEESYRLCCVVVCNLETLRMRRSWPTGGCCAKNKQRNKQWYVCTAHYKASVNTDFSKQIMTHNDKSLNGLSSNRHRFNVRASELYRNNPCVRHIKTSACCFHEKDELVNILW